MVYINNCMLIMLIIKKFKLLERASGLKKEIGVGPLLNFEISKSFWYILICGKTTAFVCHPELIKGFPAKFRAMLFKGKLGFDLRGRQIFTAGIQVATV